jgi:hypothetical protein
VYDVHLYEQAAASMARLDEAMHRYGDEQPWIIGETFYSDAEISQALAGRPAF